MRHPPQRRGGFNPGPDLRQRLLAGIALEAPSETLREIASTISRTEYWHAQLQEAFLANKPLVSAPPSCPTATGDFAADVETAISGELGAITRYAQLAMCAPTVTVRLLFMALLNDESLHVGVWTAMLNPIARVRLWQGGRTGRRADKCTWPGGGGPAPPATPCVAARGQLARQPLSGTISLGQDPMT